MSEPNVIRCLACKESFDRTSEGAQDYLDHRETCTRATTLNHPSNPNPKRSA